MEEKRTCQTCKYFHQHYVKWTSGRYVKCDSGHCVYPRLKLRRSGTKACQHYRSKEAEQS